MSISKELPVRNLHMIQPSGRSLDIERQRQVLFGHLFGPAGREYYQGMRNGSVAIDDLSRFKAAIDEHFFRVTANAHSVPEEMAQLHYTLQQENSLRVITKIVDNAFPYLKGRLGQFKNEVKIMPPSPASLFKILALPEGQVDKMLAFDVLLHLLTGDTAGLLDVRSKNAGVREHLDYWQNIFDEELYESPYGTGEEYKVVAYHDRLTNKVTRFFQSSAHFRPPRKGERMTTHTFSARRIKGYGLVYVDINEENVVDATIKALATAADNEGEIRPIQDVRGSMRMTFVNLEYQPNGCRRTTSNIPQLTLLKKEVIGLMTRHMQIVQVLNLSSQDQRPEEFCTQDSPVVPIKLEFLSKEAHLNKNYHIGVKRVVPGIEDSVYDGEAEELVFLRSLYHLVPYIRPRELFGIDTQAVLLKTIDEAAERLTGKCEDQVTCLIPEDIKVMTG